MHFFQFTWRYQILSLDSHCKLSRLRWSSSPPLPPSCRVWAAEVVPGVCASVVGYILFPCSINTFCFQIPPDHWQTDNASYGTTKLYFLKKLVLLDINFKDFSRDWISWCIIKKYEAKLQRMLLFLILFSHWRWLNVSDGDCKSYLIIFCLFISWCK